MSDIDSLIQTLEKNILDEIFEILGFSRKGLARRYLWPLFGPPAHRFSSLFVPFDQDVGALGVKAAARRFLVHFVDSVESSGAENIPRDGPVLVVSNHPGTFDSISLISCLPPRQDFKVFIANIPFLSSLPNIGKHLIVSSDQSPDRTVALRGLIRIMKAGGISLIFPTGLIDPDPNLMPDADASVENWSASLGLVLRKVPETRLVIAMVSGVLYSHWLRSPLTRLVNLTWKKQRLAELLQIVQQIFFTSSPRLTPKITFSQPFTLGILRDMNDDGDVMQAIRQQAHLLLAQHMVAHPAQQIIALRK